MNDRDVCAEEGCGHFRYHHTTGDNDSGSVAFCLMCYADEPLEVVNGPDEHPFLTEQERDDRRSIGETGGTS